MLSSFAGLKSVLSPRNRSLCSKPSPTRRSSPSRTCGLFKELQERNAELREALEHQTAPAEVLGIISRSPTDVQPVLDAIVESAARVCGIDDVVLRLREGNVWFRGLILVPYPFGRVEISIDEPQYSLDTRAWHAPHSRRPRRRTIFQCWVPSAAYRTYLGRSPSSAGGTHRSTERASHRGASLHPGADQAARNLRRPGGHRHRERPAVPRTQDATRLPKPGAATATSEILGVIASSPTDIQPVLDTVAENAARACARRLMQSHFASEGERSLSHYGVDTAIIASRRD